MLFNAPNYLIDITKLVKSHPDADQQWRMVTYNWTDRNRDGRLFTDRDRDGTLDEFPSAETTIDGDPIPDSPLSDVGTHCRDGAAELVAVNEWKGRREITREEVQLKHGRFNAWGTIIAVLLLGTGTTGLGLASAPQWAANMFVGVVLIAALAVTGIQRRASGSAAPKRTRGRLRPRTAG